jgi:sterol desaturase/sphingolipid hydroxylase (fatty acid hydroxylase superfamily)
MSSSALSTSLGSVALVLAVMAIAAVVETIIPLRARSRWSLSHLGPNLALTFITFATNLAFNLALAGVLIRVQADHLGLLAKLALPAGAVLAASVLALDLSTYVAHVLMHKVPALWRFHQVHHADPMVDVTTTIRQHPGESLIRYVFLAAPALALGVSPPVFALYRLWSAMVGLSEHANIRLPTWLDRMLALIFVTPDMHKVHHSRQARQTDSNYGNLTSLWDRLFFTFTPSREGRDVDYGLEGLAEPGTQTTARLLALPFGRSALRRRRTAEAT